MKLLLLFLFYFYLNTSLFAFENLHLKFKIAELNVSQQDFKNIKLECKNLQYTTQLINCSNGYLHISSDLIDKPIIKLSFSYHLKTQQLKFNIEQLAIADGKINIQVKSINNNWQTKLNIHNIELTQLLNIIKKFIDLPSDFTMAGRSNLTINLNTKLQQGNKVKIQGLIRLNKGEIYIDPIYLNINKQPLNMAIDLSLQPKKLNIHNLHLTQKNILDLQTNAYFKLEDKFAIERLSIKLKPTYIKKLYDNYIQAMLEEDSIFNQLKLQGMIKAQLNWQSNKRHALIKLYNINVEDQKKRFGINKLHGKLQWHSNSQGYASHLHWSNAYIASSIKLGRSQLRASLIKNKIKLLAPFYQPIFDGAIKIQQFHLNNIGMENMNGQLRGEIKPISLSKISTALDIPKLNGNISGKIPWLNYRNQAINIGGRLKMRIFDGEIIAHHLSINNLLNNIPELKANIKINKLNLKTLTNITEFGEIQGQLSGYVRKLHLIDWQPVSFDAHFANPLDDAIRHRISQKAIQNLSNLSGNLAVNIFSNSILKVFENFYYKRLGWGCRLRKGICHMSGVGATKKGYYIVQGGRLPRLDVIGYNKSVDWNQLLNRIKSISNTSLH
ncbi:hypothetical protein [Candidatus Marithrix sp. Canyon 246]|uniref:hypothetical protein n=1 Tax=Candidatus Marithrix sp. Canyon 246 TaxID=1827136 RepID=UPI00084A0D91|nr:hypothetical protein [Candidatus Marithrix sp. Canyon 246]